MTAVGRWKRGALAALLVAGVSTIWLTSISAGSSTLSITVDQGLSPNFSLAVHDYVVRCSGTPLSVSVDAPAGYGVSVDGGALKPGAFNTTVAITTGQEFTMTVRHSDTNSSYYVRCLPRDFTHYTFTAQRPAPFGMFALDTALGKYTAVFDTDGVPVWWMRTQSGAGDSEVLRD